MIGTIQHPDNVKWVLNGTWDSKMDETKVIRSLKIVESQDRSHQASVEKRICLTVIKLLVCPAPHSPLGVYLSIFGWGVRDVDKGGLRGLKPPLAVKDSDFW